VSAEIEAIEDVDLGVNLDEPIPCNGYRSSWTSVKVSCSKEAEFRLTFRHCKTHSAHKCEEHAMKFVGNMYSCIYCGQSSNDMIRTPLR
jgi:hypothetical protein